MLLARLGLGAVDAAADLTRFAGRNESWAAVTDRGHQVFIKKFHGSAEDAGRRMRRSADFENVLAKAGPLAGLDAPRCLGWDEASRLLLFEFIPGVRSGADLESSAQFGDDLAHRVGVAIGTLHTLPGDCGGPAGQEGAYDFRPLLPSLALLDALPLTVFAAASAAELQAWRLMQQDTRLIAAVGELLSQERVATHTSAHCDLRLEQVLAADDRLCVCDWEEFRQADPARDVGSFAGEWLHRAVVGLASGDGELAEGGTLSHDEMLDRVTAGLERARPKVAAFWSGYSRVRSAADSTLAERATAFAGWHLFDRMLAVAGRSPRLGAVQRAAAGIGRNAMITPAAFAGTIGLDW
ncbi:MAG: class V lanthionine synthetase subunit LxmK [Streptosporangiaceae bacterium]